MMNITAGVAAVEPSPSPWRVGVPSYSTQSSMLAPQLAYPIEDAKGNLVAAIPMAASLNVPVDSKALATAKLIAAAPRLKQVAIQFLTATKGCADPAICQARQEAEEILDSIATLDLLKPLACPSCGITGLHACPGYPIPPITAQQHAQLNEVMDEIFERKAK